MKVAYHFDPGLYGAWYGPEIEAHVFRALLVIPAERRHARLRRGDLLWDKAVETANDLPALVVRLLRGPRAVWTTLSSGDLPAILSRMRPYVVAVDGLTRAATAIVDDELRSAPGYLGALEINLANGLHWGLYEAYLGACYRVIGDELRLLHLDLQLDPEARDEALRRRWAESGLFRRVVWESAALRDTVVDDYASSPRHAALVARLQDALEDEFDGVASQLLLRLGDLDPRLVEALHGALEAFGRGDSGEQLAQAAVSCRRLLELLADALFPPREDLVKGRRVGAAEYKNRLWAFVDESLQGMDAVRARRALEDIGGRIDAFVERANRGVHTFDDVERQQN